MCVRSAVSLGRRRSSVSGGGARGALGRGRRRRSASDRRGADCGRSGGCAGLGGGLRCPRARSGGARAGQSAAATHSLTASAGARRPMRCNQSIGLVSNVSVSSLHAASHGALPPKARSLFAKLARLFGRAIGAHPSRRTRARPGLIGVLWRYSALRHAHSERDWPPRAGNTHTNVRKPPRRRRRDDSEQTTYKQEG